jgi:hypothetical protein
MVHQRVVAQTGRALASGVRGRRFESDLPDMNKWWFKNWFNQRWPHRRLCRHAWCWRGQVYDHRCSRHQDDP